MKKEYITEVTLAESLTSEPLRVYRLQVNPYDTRPFTFLTRTVSGKDKQMYWQGSANYYSLGVASKMLYYKASREAEAKGLVITSVSYTATRIIVSKLKDFYKVLDDGTVKEVR